jgi:hypothetical protein
VSATLIDGYCFGSNESGNWWFRNSVDRSTDPIDGTFVTGNNGPDHANTLRVRALGSHFDLYINGRQVGRENCSGNTVGLVGLESDAGEDAVFTNFSVSRV